MPGVAPPSRLEWLAQCHVAMTCPVMFVVVSAPHGVSPNGGHLLVFSPVHLMVSKRDGHDIGCVSEEDAFGKWGGSVGHPVCRILVIDSPCQFNS